MKFASTRLVAADIKAMVGFYELVTGQRAEWLAPVFAEIVTPSATLAIGSVETVALFKEGSAEAAANRTAIIEFKVDDVDAEFARLKDKVGGRARAEGDAVGQPRRRNSATPKGTLRRCYCCRRRFDRRRAKARFRVADRTRMRSPTPPPTAAPPPLRAACARR